MEGQIQEAEGMRIERLPDICFQILARGGAFKKVSTAGMRITLQAKDGTALFLDVGRDDFGAVLEQARLLKCDA